MLDLFVIFSKSGIVLFATVNEAVNGVMNKLVKNVILEERTEQYHSESLALQYRLDNEFELVFVVGYQKMLSLSYIDKFLDDVQLEFRDKYKAFDLMQFLAMGSKGSRQKDSHIISNGTDQPFVSTYNLVDFSSEYKKIYTKCYKSQQNAKKTEMRSFEESYKAQKTVASMIVQPKAAPQKPVPAPVVEKPVEKPSPMGMKKGMKGLTSPKAGGKAVKAMKEKEKKKKESRTWENGGKTTEGLDFSKEKGSNGDSHSSSLAKNIASNHVFSDKDMKPPNLEFESSEESSEEEEDEDEEEVAKKSSKSTGFFGSIIKTFNYNKSLTKEDLEPALSQMRDHLIGKNVASEISVKLIESVMTKLEGQHVNTWMGLKGFVRNSLEESILRILSPNRNVNILREMKVKAPNPYVIVFCGVNGVGKSTNLAKIANWLIVNGVKVMVIACDTFRAGAIEQLRTHVTALKAIHERDGNTKIKLFEKGYGKDAAGIAMEAINMARMEGFNCCLVDTAGRMQDNEPLMKQLAKLIKINEPDLTLFVGEALVGNEAVDQLTKFNNALLDNGCRGTTSNASAINGIVLTKFDTIDDQVGAAISMTYITGQPIVFVGVGQTYRDLKQLNPKAVVKALMR
jgi:signal recognition particle receptor subunit alpha